MFTCENGRCINKVRFVFHLEQITYELKLLIQKKSILTFFRVGFVTMTTIAAMAVTKANSVIHNTKRVHRKNSHVRTSSAFVHNIAVMEKTVSFVFQSFKS